MKEQPTRFYSSLQEITVANYLDGNLTPNSGAKHKKGDILLDDTIIECKTKTKGSMTHTIKKDWIKTLIKECIAMGKKHWAIVFDFGSQKLNEQYVIIPIDDYKEYLELKEDKDV